MIKDLLEIVANLAAILTAGIAALAYFHFVWGERARRRALERHLREEALHAQRRPPNSYSPDGLLIDERGGGFARRFSKQIGPR